MRKNARRTPPPPTPRPILRNFPGGQPGPLNDPPRRPHTSCAESEQKAVPRSSATGVRSSHAGDASRSCVRVCRSLCAFGACGNATSGSAKDILKMMARPGTLDQFLNLNPPEAIFTLFGAKFSCSQPDAPAQTGHSQPGTRFCGLRVVNGTSECNVRTCRAMQ
jgi:hypothetical protein